MQSAIQDKFGIVAQLIEGSGGAFEVQVNGKLVFSKLKQFRFPENDEILDIISNT